MMLAAFGGFAVFRREACLKVWGSQDPRGMLSRLWLAEFEDSVSVAGDARERAMLLVSGFGREKAQGSREDNTGFEIEDSTTA